MLLAFIAEDSCKLKLSVRKQVCENKRKPHYNLEICISQYLYFLHIIVGKLLDKQADKKYLLIRSERTILDVS